MLHLTHPYLPGPCFLWCLMCIRCSHSSLSFSQRTRRIDLACTHRFSRLSASCAKEQEEELRLLHQNATDELKQALENEHFLRVQTEEHLENCRQERSTAKDAVESLTEQITSLFADCNSYVDELHQTEKKNLHQSTHSYKKRTVDPNLQSDNNSLSLKIDYEHNSNEDLQARLIETSEKLTEKKQKKAQMHKKIWFYFRKY